MYACVFLSVLLEKYGHDFKDHSQGEQTLITLNSPRASHYCQKRNKSFWSWQIQTEDCLPTQIPAYPSAPPRKLIPRARSPAGPSPPLCTQVVPIMWPFDTNWQLKQTQRKQAKVRRMPRMFLGKIQDPVPPKGKDLHCDVPKAGEETGACR